MYKWCIRLFPHSPPLTWPETTASSKDIDLFSFLGENLLKSTQTQSNWKNGLELQRTVERGEKTLLWCFFLFSYFLLLLSWTWTIKWDNIWTFSPEIEVEWADYSSSFVVNRRQSSSMMMMGRVECLWIENYRFLTFFYFLFSWYIWRFVVCVGYKIGVKIELLAKKKQSSESEIRRQQINDDHKLKNRGEKPDLNDKIALNHIKNSSINGSSIHCFQCVNRVNDLFQYLNFFSSIKKKII